MAGRRRKTAAAPPEQGSALALVQLSLLGEAVLAAASVAVFVWDDDRNYVAVNDAACAFVGLDREELLALRVGSLSPNGGDVARVQRRPSTAGSASFTRPDGTAVEFDFLTFRTRVAGLPYMASVCWER